MEETMKAYLAGIVDGEGSFMIYLKSGGSRPDRKFHRCRLAIANTDVPLVELLHEQLGGRVNKGKPSKPHHKIVYQVVIEGPSLTPVTNLLLPYLRVKRPQAELILEMAATMSTRRTGLALTDEVLAERDRIYAKYVEAKHGPTRSWGGRVLA